MEGMSVMDNHLIAIAYLVIVSIISIIVTVSDKRKAKRGEWRVPESTLIFLSFIGGGIAMYLTMKKCRHKTKKNKFMIGIPLIIFLHIILIALLHLKLLLNYPEIF